MNTLLRKVTVADAADFPSNRQENIMTKLLIALVSLAIGWLAGRSLTVGDIQSATTPSETTITEAPYNVPGEGLQTMQVQLDAANLRVKNLEAELAARNKPSESAGIVEGPLNAAQALTLKRAFEDLQGEVAADKYPGLALTDGYQNMKKILSNPEIE